MTESSAYELEREANIARNRALLEQLDLKDAVSSLGVPKPAPKPAQKPKAKPIQPSAKRSKREREAASAAAEAPRRQSARLRKEPEADPNETPAQRRQREAEAAERRRRVEEERVEAEERARMAKRPRMQDLDLEVLVAGEEMGDGEVGKLRASLQGVTGVPIARRVGDVGAWVLDEGEDGGKKDEREVQALRKRLGKMRVVARAKVTQDRVYSAAYHPEPTKDLVLFGDKHGQLGIWDARAPPDEVADEDGDVAPADEKEGGKYWRLQSHWPATSKSSISSIKIDPIDAHSAYTTSYDCTIRQLSFVSCISRQIFASPDVLITSIDLPPSGHELWISDASGGLTHLDLREGSHKARWYALSDQKIGSVSVNPTSPHLLLTASNNRLLKIWDTRKLENLAASKGAKRSKASISPPPASPSSPEPSRSSASHPVEFEFDTVQSFVESKKGVGLLRGEFAHGKSVSSAYWDPRGRSIVSTSYDDTLRLWELNAGKYDSSPVFPSFTPFCRIKHNCQTGKWLTILRAVWNPNPEVYPHFTIGNLEHSLDIFSCKGDLITRLSDRQRITATQAVTCSHPSIVERCATGNASGRCVLWAPPDLS
ncbi:WD40-repeat-containing domain protein [Phlebopus sp. FC_14]|nr:WD40-repeat-containing domain protein [Phlebopus sp. FC_14]